MLRKFAPLNAEHAVVGKLCPVCNNLFVTGDETTLLPTFPASKEDAEKAQQGRAFNSSAEVVHWTCRNEP